MEDNKILLPFSSGKIKTHKIEDKYFFFHYNQMYIRKKNMMPLHAGYIHF